MTGTAARTGDEERATSSAAGPEVAAETRGNARATRADKRGGDAPAGRTSDASSFVRLERTSVGLQAVETIKALILSGDLQPGDALPSERELAVMLGISRPSLREAIRVLSAMNVLEPRHGGGTYVTSLDPRLLAQPVSFLLQIEPAAFRHLHEVRQVLEVGAVRLAAPRITEDALDNLQQLAEAAEEALADPARYTELDFAIHTAIVEATGNPICLSLYESIADLSLESRRRTARTAAVRQRAHEDHVAIIAALHAHDADAAAQAMSSHLEAMQHALIGEDAAARPATSSPSYPTTPLASQ
jgi:GntR family transcriptional regulator, transcriptional repressor for pyruvate dehydrogenase complex